MPARLRPTAPIAPDAILVGDPGRALMLAQELLQQPKMSNHARGLWGYSGVTPADRELTIQSTGMGGPSASVVLDDLAELGVRRAIRVGTCVALSDLDLGEFLVVNEALTPGGERFLPDLALTDLLEEALEGSTRGLVVSLDSLFRPEAKLPSLVAEGADMQTAGLLGAAGDGGVAVAAVLIAAERSDAGQLSEGDLEEAAKRAGQTAATVLSS
jgi:uridine phosphorylase